MEHPDCPGCRERDTRIARLEQQMAELLARIRDLEARFRLEARLLRFPDEKWHLQQEADQASTAHTMGEAANDNIKPKLDAANDNAKPVTKRHEPFRTERHYDAHP